ncbi:MAG: sel1 repeat family protein [Sandaracinaceae bacterium]|nr:sel1 repeat family protein [Sandaracinaceae bacterium]
MGDDEYELPQRRWWEALSVPGLIAAVAAMAPFFAHLTLNGQDYVKVGAGGTAILFGGIAIGWELLRSARGQAYRRGFGGLAPVLALAAGGFHLFTSGFAMPGLLDRSDAVRQILEDEGRTEIEIGDRSDDGNGYSFTARDGDTLCEGSVRFVGAFGTDDYQRFEQCGIPRPVEDLERDCEAGEGHACALAAARLRDADPVDWPRATALSQRACDRGERGECFEVGVAYGWGERGVPANQNLAFVSFTLACEGGTPEACLNVGVQLRDGEGVAADEEGACEHFEQACNANHVPGCAELGECYRLGRGRPRDFTRAHELLSRGCEAEAGTACANLGYLYENGQGVEANDAQAFDHFRLGCRYGEQVSCAEAARMQLEGRSPFPDRAAAVPELSRLCDSHVGTACTSLGVQLHQGIEGVLPQDRARAWTLFERGCAGGSAACCRNQSVYLTDGLGGQTPDPARARALRQRACDLGSRQACDELR